MQSGTSHIHRPCRNAKTLSDRIKQAQEHSANSRAAQITLSQAPWEEKDDG